MTNPENPDMRAGTRDRDACAQVLNEAMAQGRLSADEHDERLSRCYAAVTLADLAALTADLPARTPAATPPPSPPETVPFTGQPLAAQAGKTRLKAMWASWAGVSIMMVVIWALTAVGSDDGMPSFWPMWVIGPWGAVNIMVSLMTWAGKRD